jgi:hypothetical protein
MFTFLPSCSHVHIARQNTYSYEQTTNEVLTCLTSCLYSQSSRWLNVSKDILTNSLSTNNLKIILEVLVKGELEFHAISGSRYFPTFDS